MTVDLEKVKIYLRPGVTDLRKAANGLIAMIAGKMGKDPSDGSVYLFCNRDRKLLKAIYWEETGYWLCQKRLEEAKFPWAETGEEVSELSVEEIKLLLRGIDFWKAHKPVHYKRSL